MARARARQLDLFSIFAAVTCVGIAVNYGIYILHRYDRRPAGCSRSAEPTAAIMIACHGARGVGTLIISAIPAQVFGLCPW
jgi:predicted RND superfamily exporter protein